MTKIQTGVSFEGSRSSELLVQDRGEQTKHCERYRCCCSNMSNIEDGKGQNIKVVLRCRPMTNAEAAKDKPAIKCASDKHVEVNYGEVLACYASHACEGAGACWCALCWAGQIAWLFLGFACSWCGVAACAPPNVGSFPRPVACICTHRGCTAVCWCQWRVAGVMGKTSKKSFTFDGVYDENSSQKQVYEGVVRPVVDEVLQGYNCTVFAYGQVRMYWTLSWIPIWLLFFHLCHSGSASPAICSSVHIDKHTSIRSTCTYALQCALGITLYVTTHSVHARKCDAIWIPIIHMHLHTSATHVYLFIRHDQRSYQHTSHHINRRARVKHTQWKVMWALRLPECCNPTPASSRALSPRWQKHALSCRRKEFDVMSCVANKCCVLEFFLT